MPDPIIDELRRLAGPDLYTRNAFRISGLQATADRRTTRQVVQRMRAALEVGADVDLGTATSRDPHEIQAACDLILGDPRRRLVHELFAAWGDDVTSCGCEPAQHKDHDDAVDAHRTAIDFERALNPGEAGPNGYWQNAATAWTRILDNLDTHLTSRIRALDDRQLDTAAIAAVRRELPRTLTQPAVDLAVSGRIRRTTALVALARQFAPSQVRWMLEAAATTLYETLEDGRDRVGDDLDRRPAGTLVATLNNDLLPKLQKLDALLPPDENHRTARLHDQFAILYNNCAVELINKLDVADGRAGRWLDRAAELAIGAEEQDLIERNRSMLTRVAYATGAPPPRHRPPRRHTSTYKPAYEKKRSKRWVVWLLVLAAIVAGIVWWARPDRVSIYHDRISDNPKVGSCLDRQDSDWLSHPDKLKPRDCAKPHWGEVLAYVPLAAVPAPYPGDDQATALARYKCGEAAAQRSLDPKEFDVDQVHAPAKYWNTGKNKYENYASCVVHRHDGSLFVGGGSRVGGTTPTAKPRPVAMDLFSWDVAGNAPIGGCVQSRITAGSAAKAQIIRCTEWHWAEVVAYPTLYGPSEAWPGDTAVYAKAAKSCPRARPGFTTMIGWPDQSWWQATKQTTKQTTEQSKYAYCLVHRVDGKPFKGGLR